MSNHFIKANQSSSWLLVLGAVAILSNSYVKPVKGQRFCGKVLTNTLNEYCEIFPTLAPLPKRAEGDQTIQGTNYREVSFPNLPNVVEQPDADRIFGTVGKFNSKPNWMRALFSAKDGTFNGNTGMGDDFTGLLIPDRFQLGKRGVVDDCCHQTCSLEYLLTNYCG